LFLFDTIVTPPAGKRVGLLIFQPDRTYSEFAAVEILTTRNCLAEAASNLYSAMRRLECLNLDMIFAVTVPSTGLGIAINDRLRRASQKAQDIRI
jgi:L-threonylcarbamoyladenylate synthase